MASSIGLEDASKDLYRRGSLEAPPSSPEGRSPFWARRKVLVVSGLLALAGGIIAAVSVIFPPIGVAIGIGVLSHALFAISAGLVAAGAAGVIYDRVKNNQDPLVKVNDVKQVLQRFSIPEKEIFGTRDHFDLAKIDTVKDSVEKQELRRILDLLVQKIKLFASHQDQKKLVPALVSAVRSVVKLMGSEKALAIKDFAYTRQGMQKIKGAMDEVALAQVCSELEIQNEQLDLRIQVRELKNFLSSQSSDQEVSSEASSELEEDKKATLEKKCDDIILDLQKAKTKEEMQSLKNRVEELIGLI